MARSTTELAEQVVRRHTRLSSERSVWDAYWQDIANYVMPRKAEILTTQLNPGADKEAQLFDGTAIRANMVLANGQLSWMTPMESRWFSYDPPAKLKGVDIVEQYYKECSEVAAVELARSNFYSEIHELYLDRGAFGTAVLYAEEGRRYPINFRKFDIGSFSIAEDSEGYVDTLSREFELTARQAVEMFGAEEVHEDVRKDAEDPHKCETKSRYIHLISPRPESEREQGKRDGRNKPIASVYVDLKHKHVCRDAGFDEQPFFCTRYLKWTSSTPYGWCPSWMALPEARQLNFLEMQMDALAELAAFPRFLLPDTHEGEIDFRAAGVTYFDPNNPNAIPREWATQGRYDVGLQRAEWRRRAINEAFHVDLFQMFAQLNKQMTAREVSERSSEKLIQFSPTFARMTTELFNPLLRRVFSILSRAGLFPPPPMELIQQDGKDAWLPEPEVSYSSRIALAIRALENNSFARTLELVMPLSGMRPEIMDNFDLDTIIRDMSRNDGLPARWLVAKEAVEQARGERAQAQAQAMQTQQAATLAGAAKDAGAIKDDSVLGQALQQAL